jgi:hypothetical protein
MGRHREAAAQAVDGVSACAENTRRRGNKVMNAQQIAPMTPDDDSATVLSMISRAASDPAVDIDKLERLMAMRERMQARQSETEFNQAMNRAQGKMRRIATDSDNPQTRSKYASYAALDRVLRPLYVEEGFSLSFDNGDSPAETVRVLCHVSHAGGHTRTYHTDMPADGKGAKGGDVMTKTHASGSAMTYGMRYLLKMIFNVAIGEDDNDGNDPDPYDAADWYTAIGDATSMDELNRIGGELKSAGVPAAPLRNIRAMWVKRSSELKGA